MYGHKHKAHMHNFLQHKMTDALKQYLYWNTEYWKHKGMF